MSGDASPDGGIDAAVADSAADADGDAALADELVDDGVLDDADGDVSASDALPATRAELDAARIPLRARRSSGEVTGRDSRS